MLRVTFEDHHQDFLEWYIKDDVVVACEPFQDWMWNGTIVHNTDIRPGDILEIELRDGYRSTLKYPVESVETIDDE